MGADDELSGMLTYEDALARVLAQTWRVEAETVELDEALGRILAQDAVSDMDMPPFDKSAVDGYACRNADTSNELSVLGIIPAGCFPDRVVGQGEAMKIMTGAPLPSGADCVVMKEHVEEMAEGRMRVNVAAHAGKKNFCTQAEDVRTGDIVLKAGTRLTPQSLAVLASVGVSKPIVSRRVRVGVFSTGTELVSPEEKPGPGQIRNSNSVQITAQAESCGAEVRRYGIVADDESSLRDTVQRALAENDLVISTGGVSVGDFDLMPEIFTSVGMTIHLRKVAIQPGKPIVFASDVSGGMGVPPMDSKTRAQDLSSTLQIRRGSYLPHWTCDDATYSVTFRLADSLPKHVLEQWVFEREDIIKRSKQLGRPLSPCELIRLEKLHSEKVENFLDTGHGGCWMKDEEIRKIVSGALQHFNGERYTLFAWCVMPNHVHVVLRPHQGNELSEILHSWKSFSAKRANTYLGRKGEFWQPEYYDHLIRDEQDFDHAVDYVLSNPVKAGLVNWKWVSGGMGVPPMIPTPHGRDAHATSNNKACFGLSGNPVSSFLQFTLFAKPFIEAMGGMTPSAKWVCAPLAQNMHRKHTERMQWFPVVFTENGSVAPVNFHGSAHVHALSGADGLAAYPIGVETLKEGEMLRICLT